MERVEAGVAAWDIWRGCLKMRHRQGPTKEPEPRSPMKIKLHHVNLCSTNVPAMDEFYRTVLDLKPEPGLNASPTPGGAYPGKVAVVSAGTTQLHLAETD